MSTAAPARPRALRIGEVARMVGTTPRTIRYYEEIGLLSREAGRESGQHRAYGEPEVERLRDALRLKELLGLTLDELKTVLEAEEPEPPSAPSCARATPPRRAAASCSRRRMATSSASSAWCAGAATRSPSSSATSSRAARACAARSRPWTASGYGLVGAGGPPSSTLTTRWTLILPR